jgi:predicted acyl esterase
MKKLYRSRAAIGFWVFALLCGGSLAGSGAVRRPAAPQAGKSAPAPAAKQTFMVPMRDSVKLATDVYVPDGKGPFPVILLRSPYNKDATAAFGAEGARRGYAVVMQDTRGRFASEGENLPFATDGWTKQRDGYDTLEWVAAQPWCGGKIGTFGGSALGITQLQMAGTGTSRLAAQHITVGAPSLYHDAVFPGGVFKKAMIEDWLRVTRFSPEALAIWTSHPDYDDYWRDRDVNRRYEEVDAPAVHIGGWFDLFTQGTLDAFTGYQTEGGPRARRRQKLVMGPWTHGVLQDRAGELTFPNGRTPPGGVHDVWRWFDYTLKGLDNGMASAPAVTYYVMGDTSDPAAPGNVWRTAAKWPPAETSITAFYLHEDRTLSPRKPAEGKPLAYDYDPKNPVPTVGGPQLTLPAGPMDQRKIETRPDVLTFTSESLTEPVEVTGRVRLRLWAASDAPDTDFFAKLCDVYPDGRCFNLCEGQLRARFRESFRREQMLRPGRIERFDIDLCSTSIVFNRGHRLGILVTSSNAPGFDPNPNTGEPFRSSTRTQVARNTIYLDTKHPSHVLLPVVGSVGTSTHTPSKR